MTHGQKNIDTEHYLFKDSVISVLKQRVLKVFRGCEVCSRIS